MEHNFNIERDAEPKNPFGAKLYCKFIVNCRGYKIKNETW